MNKSQRIYLNTGTTNTNKTIIFKLEQDVELIEFMSMSIYTKDAYQDFNSNYGVLIGRVIANGGIGISNAKISIFIPLTDTDAEDGTITSIYPYTTPRDKNAQGKRYNLLPRVAEFDPVTRTYSPKQPFGSFPIKPEIVSNQDFLDIYKKYYKYTALTNSAGDYMIFGVPVGLQTVHLSVDITDIGKYSMTPASMVINLGYSPNLFMNDNKQIKPSDDLNDLPNIETQEISVNVIPFWGDKTNFIIGITRQDFRIRSILDNTFVIFGSAFTDDDNSMWGSNPESGKNIRELYYINGANSEEKDVFTGIQSKRIGTITENIYYYPNNITDAKIDGINADPINDMALLAKSQYSVYKRDGDFVFIISCNRNKVITDDFGNEIPVDDSSPNGIFTKFRGFITLEITPEAIPMNFTGSIGTEGGATTVVPYRFKLKIPQYAGVGQSFTQPISSNVDATVTQNWRKQHTIFSGGTLYTISNFHGTVVNTQQDDSAQVLSLTTNFLISDEVNSPYNTGSPNRDYHYQTGIIQTNDGTFESINVSGNTQYQMPHNSFDNFGRQFFAGNWLNFSLYLPQMGNLTLGYSSTNYIRTTENFTKQIPSSSDNHQNSFFLFDNVQWIAANQFNTKWFARSDLHWTDFVVVPKKDVLTLASIQLKGFATGSTTALTGKYRNGYYNPPNWIAPCPRNGGKLNGNPLQPDASDPNTYFYKGFSGADCIDFVISLGLI